ncbi:transketolase [Acanthopleuribacter pedis]|uniref:Transketolase n=1 Tax=Acanthopleuribacter pedis TaxID=442870 RepID=A0A8J7Q772_9BACT|nr:transketolase [Acanthopleuribacter pedis]MBO1318034.1 transketolase [Acanthopleuribacter pedis]
MDAPQTKLASADLERRALQARRLSLAMIYHAKSGHPGGSLSAVDLLTVLYFQELQLTDAAFSDWNRPRFVLSKGHACPAHYAVAALAGLLPMSELGGLRKINRALQGHPHVGATPFVEASTGSLGQGFSIALGMALGFHHRGVDLPVFAMLGDGELQEGQVWETAMFAAHYRLNRFCAVIDYNKLQSDARNSEIMGLEPLGDKWRSFGWAVQEIDGHDLEAIQAAFGAFHQEKDKPTVIIAHTIKGKGVGYMEDIPAWHGSVKLTDDNLLDALAACGVTREQGAAYLSGAVFEEANP